MTHHFFGNITLNDNLIETLRVLAHTRTSGELLRKEFSGLFQVNSECVKTVDGGDVLSLVSGFTLDGDLCVRKTVRLACTPTKSKDESQ